MSKIKILLVDDHAVLRAGLKTLLNSQADMEVVAEASDGSEALRENRRTNPNIVLMDVTMPGISSLEATKIIKQMNPAVKVLVLSMHDDGSHLRQMLHAGADGYIPKKAADIELLAAIRATYRGEHFIHSSMTTGIIDELSQTNPVSGNDQHIEYGLSKREVDVLSNLALGHTDQEIADKLYLSIKTVQTYKARVKEKLGVKGRAELVRYAIYRGLIDT
jgi:DNA-binding NarL/FixJ family response regulator